MDFIALAAVGGVAFWMYTNYQRNKEKIAALAKRIEAIEARLEISPVTRRN